MSFSDTTLNSYDWDWDYKSSSYVHPKTREALTGNLKDEANTELFVLNGKLHREDGPALILYDGTMQWYQHGVLHRTNGPARIYSSNFQEYYLYGKRYDKEEWFEALTKEEKKKVIYEGIQLQ